VRAGFCRVTVTAVLAAVVGVLSTATPARADVPGDVRLPTGPVVTFVFGAYKMYQGNLAAGDLERLVLAVITASDQARDQVISHLDQHIAARATGEAEALSIQFENYTAIRQSWAVYQFVSDALTSATIDKNELNATADLKAADVLGHALNVAYSYAIAAAPDAGYTPAGKAALMNSYIQANQAILTKLAPTCTSTVAPDTPLFISEVRYECVAANGERSADYQIRNLSTGAWIRGPVNVEQLKVDAAINSSWVIAKEILPTLRP
jgi:hypothetical protein